MEKLFLFIFKFMNDLISDWEVYIFHGDVTGIIFTFLPFPKFRIAVNVLKYFILTNASAYLCGFTNPINSVLIKHPRNNLLIIILFISSHTFNRIFHQI